MWTNSEGLRSDAFRIACTVPLGPMTTDSTCSKYTPDADFALSSAKLNGPKGPLKIVLAVLRVSREEYAVVYVKQKYLLCHLSILDICNRRHCACE